MESHDCLMCGVEDVGIHCESCGGWYCGRCWAAHLTDSGIQPIRAIRAGDVLHTLDPLLVRINGWEAAVITSVDGDLLTFKPQMLPGRTPLSMNETNASWEALERLIARGKFVVVRERDVV